MLPKNDSFVPYYILQSKEEEEEVKFIGDRLGRLKKAKQWGGGPLGMDKK